MVSRRGLLARVGFVLTLSAVLARVAASQEPAGTLILNNTRWDQARVEVRLGTTANCQAHNTTSIHTLERGKRWAIVSRNEICWRRERSPTEVERGWTAWEHVRVPPGTKQEVEL